MFPRLPATSAAPVERICQSPLDAPPSPEPCCADPAPAADYSRRDVIASPDPDCYDNLPDINSGLLTVRGKKKNSFMSVLRETDEKGSNKQPVENYGRRPKAISLPFRPKIRTTDTNAYKMSQAPKPVKFKFQIFKGGPSLLHAVLVEKGWRSYAGKQRYGRDNKPIPDTSWNFRFQTWDCSDDLFRQIRPWQRVNKFPGDHRAIFQKDHLARNVLRNIKLHGKLFFFLPPTFTLPQDELLLREFCRIRYSTINDDDEEEAVCNLENYYKLLMPLPAGQEDFWILKPAGMSRGEGITVVEGLHEALEIRADLMQVYIPRPLLVSGFKFDLRLFVAVASYQPLRVYIYEEGLVRWATDPFNLNDTQNIFSHLTNTSINDHSPTYHHDKPVIGRGCRWKLSRLQEFFLALGVDDRMLWQHISRIVICTLLMQVDFVPPAPCSRELLGFDILIDERFVPWLLEVNRNPSLANICRTDYLVKKPMLRDFIAMLRFKPRDKYCGKREPKVHLWEAKTDYSIQPSTAFYEPLVSIHTDVNRQQIRSTPQAAATRAGTTHPRGRAQTPAPDAASNHRCTTPATCTRSSESLADDLLPGLTARLRLPIIVTDEKGRKYYYKSEGYPAEALLPPMTYGGFKLIFPFNMTTLQMVSMEDADKKVIIKELHRVMLDVAAACLPGGPPPGSLFTAEAHGYPFAIHQTIDPFIFAADTWPGARAEDKIFNFRSPDYLL